MKADDSNEGTEPQRPAGYFPTTHWSVVLAAGNTADTRAAQALDQLCRTYWYPLYAYVRRRGFDAVEAQDLTQSFFAHLLSGPLMDRVDPDKGRFRTYLLSCIQNFLAKEWRRSETLKRGGGQVLISIDQTKAEEWYAIEPVETETPEILFERRWALTLLHQVLQRLEAEYAAKDKQPLFGELRGFLMERQTPDHYAQIAARTGIREPALRQAVRRMRQRYRLLLREEIANTVKDPAKVDEELRHLFSAVG